MADLIKIKGGNGNVPELQDKELGYRKDEKALYIGTDNGNVRLCGANDISSLRAYIDAHINASNAKNNEIDQLIITISDQISALENSVANIISRLDAMTISDE